MEFLDRLTATQPFKEPFKERMPVQNQDSTLSQHATHSLCPCPDGEHSFEALRFRKAGEAKTSNGSIVTFERILADGTIDSLVVPRLSSPTSASHGEGFERNRDGFVGPLPIDGLADHTGEVPFSGRLFADFVKDTVAVQRTSVGSSIDAILENRFPELSCDLGDDWDFSAIECRASHSEGHFFRNREIPGLLDAMVRIGADLENAALQAHNGLSAHALSRFWTSWPVWNHFAVWCDRVNEELVERGRGADLPTVRAAIAAVQARAWEYAQQLRLQVDAAVQHNETGHYPTSHNATERNAAKRSQPKRKRPKDRTLDTLRAKVRKMYEAGYTHQQMCERLGKESRPPSALWRDIDWPAAYRSKEYGKSVKKWLSKASGS